MYVYIYIYMYTHAYIHAHVEYVDSDICICPCKREKDTTKHTHTHLPFRCVPSWPSGRSTVLRVMHALGFPLTETWLDLSGKIEQCEKTHWLIVNSGILLAYYWKGIITIHCWNGYKQTRGPVWQPDLWRLTLNWGLRVYHQFTLTSY